MTDKLKDSLPISLNLKSVNPLPENIQKYFKLCKEKLGLIPNVLKAYSHNTEKLNAFTNMYNEIMLAESGLSKLQREMIAVVVSSINRCLYCCVSHSFTLGKLINDPLTSKNILINYKTANLNNKHTKMLDFVDKLTTSSYLIDDTDRNNLRKVKFSENHILEIIEVCAFFNMTNRIASGTNMIPNKEYYFSQ